MKNFKAIVYYIIKFYNKIEFAFNESLVVFISIRI